MNHHHTLCNKNTRLPRSLLLFDLDGLLVDSEIFHWMAYQQMVEQLGGRLGWDYPTYLQVAGSGSHAVRERLAEEFPDLFDRYSWDEMYGIKREQVTRLLDTNPVPLMPGVERFLSAVKESSGGLAVVTHSPLLFVEQVRAAHPILSTIDLWVYREMYTNPKPAPDGYTTACAIRGVVPEETVGFEDSWRGIEALSAAGCRPILVNGQDGQLRRRCQELSLRAVSSFEELVEDFS